jgi:hypothetical protein
MVPSSGSMLSPLGRPAEKYCQKSSNDIPASPSMPSISAMISPISASVAATPIPRSISAISASSRIPDPSWSYSSNVCRACSGSFPAENVIFPHAASRVPRMLIRIGRIGARVGNSVSFRDGRSSDGGSSTSIATSAVCAPTRFATFTVYVRSGVAASGTPVMTPDSRSSDIPAGSGGSTV